MSENFIPKHYTKIPNTVGNLASNKKNNTGHMPHVNRTRTRIMWNAMLPQQKIL
jgi:hypothetical protein